MLNCQALYKDEFTFKPDSPSLIACECPWEGMTLEKAAFGCWGKSSGEGRGSWHLKKVWREHSLILGKQVLWRGLKAMNHQACYSPY